MYCYFIALVGNWIFLVVLCVDYINLLYITLETLYVCNFTFVVKLLFMSMPLLTNNRRKPHKKLHNYIPETKIFCTFAFACK